MQIFIHSTAVTAELEDLLPPQTRSRASSSSRDLSRASSKEISCRKSRNLFHNLH
ncbi:hypothetical protein Scep_001471 [Stephania cephalantha]|uniref:Uncharacterized protein n=1 Tax=Stephania cephalantha TaxID=152367 RepID=A0AAP0L946_9MAGN